MGIIKRFTKRKPVMEHVFSDINGDGRTVEQMIAENINFVSTRKIWTPSVKTKNEIDDIAAVVAGVKTAGSCVEHSEVGFHNLIKKAYGQGLSVFRVPELRDDITNLPYSWGYLVGEPDSVQMVLDSENAKTLVEHDIMQGKGYGYHKKAIADYIKKSEENDPHYSTRVLKPIPGPMKERELSRVTSVNELLEWNKDFVPTDYHPHPYLITGDELDDVAAVVAGRKPAALLKKDDNDTRQPQMLELAKNAGYTGRR